MFYKNTVSEQLTETITVVKITFPVKPPLGPLAPLIRLLIVLTLLQVKTVNIINDSTVRLDRQFGPGDVRKPTLRVKRLLPNNKTATSINSNIKPRYTIVTLFIVATWVTPPTFPEVMMAIRTTYVIVSRLIIRAGLSLVTC